MLSGCGLFHIGPDSIWGNQRSQVFISSLSKSWKCEDPTNVRTPLYVVPIPGKCYGDKGRKTINIFNTTTAWCWATRGIDSTHKCLAQHSWARELERLPQKKRSNRDGAIEEPELTRRGREQHPLREERCIQWHRGSITGTIWPGTGERSRGQTLKVCVNSERCYQLY